MLIFGKSMVTKFAEYWLAFLHTCCHNAFLYLKKLNDTDKVSPQKWEGQFIMFLKVDGVVGGGLKSNIIHIKTVIIY